MSCSVGPNSTVISMLCSAHSAPVLLGRSIFHEEKDKTPKGKANPEPTTVARWLTSQRKLLEKDSNVNAARRTRLLTQSATLIEDVKSGKVSVDTATFIAWKVLAKRLTEPTADDATLPPITAHRIRDEHLLRLLPDTQPEDLTQVRQAFARYITYHARRDGHVTWQQAWNAFTGATPNTDGSVRYRPHQCADCGGFGYFTKDARREDGRSTGVSMLTNSCSMCRGTGRPRGTIEATARWIEAPPADETR